MVLAELGKSITNALKKFNNHLLIDQKALHQCLNQICLALLHADINVKFVQKIKNNIETKLKKSKEEGANIRKMVKLQVIQQLTALLSVKTKPFTPKKGKTNVVMFVGLQGSGKTTTCAKYAYYYQKKGWKVALVCCDTFRAGAFDQLKQNAYKIRVAFFGKEFQHDPVAVAMQGVQIFKKQKFELIIIDTSGKHKQQSALFQEMKQIEIATKPDQIIFVLDSLIGQQCYAQADAFRKAVQIGSVIITKLDGHAKGGGALSAVAATQSPIIFIGKGEHFTQLQSFDPESFIKSLMGQPNMKKLYQQVKQIVPPETQAELMQKVKKGQFTMRDLKAQFSSILKSGTINGFINMIPGVNHQLLNKQNEAQSITRIKRLVYILDSMTSKQLDSKVQIDESRAKRLARGSGTSMQQVRILMDQYKRLKIMVQKASKSGCLNRTGKDIEALKRNPNQLMGQMQKVIDPKAINQMGGMQNIMSMMKDMNNSGQLTEMMKGINQVNRNKKK